MSRASVWTVALLLASAGAAAAQDVGPLPGERRHVLKTARELVRLATTKDDAARCEALLEVADARVRELERLPGERLDGVGRGYHELMGGVRASIERASARDRDMSAAVARYVEAADRHTAAIERALARASRDAAAELGQALETTRRAREEAGAAFLRGRDRARGTTPADDARRGREADAAAGRDGQGDRPKRPAWSSPPPSPGERPPRRDGQQGQGGAPPRGGG
ncbi:MAG: hypothetical protein M9894_23610 [Planctomycetes bacterium]|nr:hypothetical protein [Planctomycetota bacterium]